ncbi:MAG TPA: hypothetical protein VKT51_05475 [Candidatus Eremiobacteraceae bacterium]|nr:hypothetical protein [Candidatus Eremiobacteraceae bacterium]
MLTTHRLLLRCLLIASVISSSAAGVRGETVHLGSLVVPHAAAVPPIDGTLDNPAWKAAAVAHLSYDLRDHAAAKEDTAAYTLTDGVFLYVGIEARQSIPVRTTEHTNGVGLDTDDEVQVDLWPNGTRGFRYKFTSTAIGTHYQYSTENNSFEPEWWSAGKVVPGGYTITMKIPLAVMHGTGSGDWRIQFIRYMPVTNHPFVWSFGPAQTDFNDVNYSGSLSGLPRLAALREKPRFGIYALGKAASAAAGGSAIREGADISIPLISGTSFVGTLYPDYSNVETDQQTIAPTVFPRIYQEVRPFFTQGANFYSYPNGICSACPGIIEFYTPIIPTPREGYAVEGQRGLFSYGMLHTTGIQRDDTAEAVNYVTPNQKTALNFQGSMVDTPDLHDVADGMTFTHSNLTDLEEFARFGNNSGSQVLDGSQAQRYEAGAGVFSPNGSSLFAVLRKVGLYFDPTDGLVQHPDIAGYDVNFSKPFKFAPTARFIEFDVNGDLDRYHDHTGAMDQSVTNVSGSLTTRTLFNVQVSTGSSYVRLQMPHGEGEFMPVTQQGGQLGYNLNSAMPSFVAFNSGRFGPGRLDTWTRSATVRLGTRGALSLEADDTDQAVDDKSQFADAGEHLTQWLERASFSYQSGPNQSLALGVRRIIGTPPEFTTAPTAQSAWNISAAFHQKVVGGEIFLAYGDASLLSTAPQFILKFIRYVGAEKGT